MSQRSLKSSVPGQQRAKQAMKRKGLTQSYLAIEAGLSTRNSVWKFLSGRPVERHIFMELCFQLDLDWQEIADLDGAEDDSNNAEIPTVASESNTLTFEAIEAQLKAYFCQHHFSLTSPFDFTKHYDLTQIYTIPKNLRHLSSQQWLEVSDLELTLVTESEKREIESNLPSILETLQRSAKLLILGKPGSGKTLLLKFLAQVCFQDQLLADRMPLLLSFQDWVLAIKDQENRTLADVIQLKLSAILNHQTDVPLDRLLLLLDGLDEIPYDYRDLIFNQIRELTNKTPNLALVMTSRITPHLPHFRGINIVELADFSGPEIQDYVHRRFQPPEGLLNTHPRDNKAATFLELLRRPEHKLILNMARTPLLLELICCTFQERLRFPQRAIKLYQEGLEILLRRSQYTQHAQADSFYRDLPLAEKLKLLSLLAAVMFQQGSFYIEKSDLITIIYQYLQDNFGEKLNGEDVLLKSENILQGIQLHHGLLVEQAKNIFSFSHLTFQEYLTARHLVNQLTVEKSGAQWLAIADRVNDPRWLEVIRLMLALLPTADQFLGQLKQAIDHTVWTNPVLSPLLTVLTQKADAIQSPYPPAAVRSFYFGLLFVRDLNLVSLIVQGMVANLYPEMDLDLYLVRLYEQVTTFTTDRQADALINLALAFDLENRFTLAPPLKSGLRDLRLNLVDALQGTGAVTDWWQSNGDAWQQTLTDLLREQRQLPLGVNLTPELQQQLQQYYTNNIFLLQCLNGDCRVTPTAKDQLVSEILTVSVAESA